MALCGRTRTIIADYNIEAEGEYVVVINFAEKAFNRNRKTFF